MCVCSHKYCFSGHQFSLTQLVPSFLGWRMGSWVQDPLGEVIFIYIKEKQWAFQKCRSYSLFGMLSFHFLSFG